jgi:hypothetical protein
VDLDRRVRRVFLHARGAGPFPGTLCFVARITPGWTLAFLDQLDIVNETVPIIPGALMKYQCRGPAASGTFRMLLYLSFSGCDAPGMPAPGADVFEPGEDDRV